MSETFIISDTHFGHANIIKYCNRPFANAQEMDEQLIENWNSVVKDGDTVFHLGDFTFHKNPIVICDIVKKLNGNIHLILGNHDHTIRMLIHAQEGFASISEHAVRWGMMMNHYPIHTQEYKNKPAPNVVTDVLFYGHVHDKPVDTTTALCVCCELTNYKPLTLEEAYAKMITTR